MRKYSMDFTGFRFLGVIVAFGIARVSKLKPKEPPVCARCGKPLKEINHGTN